MKNYLERVPWAVLSLGLQLFGLWAAYYLYSNDYGYGNGRDFSYSLSFSYWVLGIVGILGVITAMFGMGKSIWKERWAWILLKLPLVYIPCLFLSITWFYVWLVLLAWV